MKIRTDFVTNSSSSSFITIVITMKDGREIQNLYCNPRMDYLLAENHHPISEIEDFQRDVASVSITEELSGDVLECFDDVDINGIVKAELFWNVDTGEYMPTICADEDGNTVEYISEEDEDWLFDDNTED